MAMIPCPKCGESISEHSKFCIYCGAKFVKDVCPACGAEIEENAKFCANCGKQIEEAKPAPVQKTETKAEQKEEGQEIPGPFEIVEGWKQSSAFARFLCSGWYSFIRLLYSAITMASFVAFTVVMFLAAFTQAEDSLIYFFLFVWLLSINAFLLGNQLANTLSFVYCRLSISHWIENQGYNPMAIVRKISKASNQRDIRKLKGNFYYMNAIALHPYIIVEAAFIVNRKDEKKYIVIWPIISLANLGLTLFFMFIPEFIAALAFINMLSPDLGLAFIMNLFTIFGTILVNPLSWIAIIISVADTIVQSIIASKREKRKGVWLSSVY